MNLKILVPFQVFLDQKNILKLSFDTSRGSYGFLPRRLDCIAAIVPSILMIETKEDGVSYIALNNGILVKTDSQVLISVRNAIGGSDLGSLRSIVEKEFLELDESEKKARSLISKMESSFLSNLQKLSSQ